MEPIPNVVVLIGANVLGRGDDELGAILMRSFIKTLKAADPPPRTMIFLNTGVHLSTAGSELLPDLQELVARGVELLSCGTCLDFFHKKEQLAAGAVSNMGEIVSRLMGADRIVTP